LIQSKTGEKKEMNGIPVLYVEADCVARGWEQSLIELHRRGCRIRTQYDREGDPASRDCTMILTIMDPEGEPMIHKDIPCGAEELEEYVMEVCEGIKDHLIRNPEDVSDTRWDYTYHQRLFDYCDSGGEPFDQIEAMCRALAQTPHTRRAQAVTWRVGEDSQCFDPPCLQSVWCRITEEEEGRFLNMNVRFRSNDAYKAAFMNIFALTRLQKNMAGRIAELSGQPVRVGRYCHMADSYHIYGSSFHEFEKRFLGALEKRTFEERTIRYEDVREMMEEARPAILRKAKNLGR
jgi:thymidylate synthase